MDKGSTCDKIALSQANLPPLEPLIPNYPLEHVCVDYTQLNGRNYVVYVNRYTGWLGMFSGGTKFDATRFLSRLCEEYVVTMFCTSDGGPNLTAKAVEDMMAE